VELPTGEVLAVDDPRLLDRLRGGLREDVSLSLLQSERALTDCRPISIISRETVRQLGDEAGRDLDKRRFRANVFIDLASASGFAEDAWVGRRLRIGVKAEVAIMARDTRCKMITLDPDTAEPDPEVMRVLAKGHDTKAGVYAVVLIEGTIRTGDEIQLMD
jgi:uncharacterized protein YcbX